MSSEVGQTVESSGIPGSVPVKFRYGCIKTFSKAEVEKEPKIYHLQQRRHYDPQGPTAEIVEKPHIRINGPQYHEDVASGVKKVDEPKTKEYVRKEKSHVFYEIKPKTVSTPNAENAAEKPKPIPEMKYHFQKPKREEYPVEKTFKKVAKPSNLQQTSENGSVFLVCGSENLKTTLNLTKSEKEKMSYSPLVTRNEQLSGVITRDPENISPFENKLTKLDKELIKTMKKKEMGDIYKEDIALLKTLK